MSDPRIEKWADVLTGYCVDVQPGQSVAIGGGVAAEPLLRAIYAKVVERGGFPVIVPELSGLSSTLIGAGNDDQLSFINPYERFRNTDADCSITVMAEGSPAFTST